MQPKLLTESDLTEYYDLLKSQGFSFAEKCYDIEAWVRKPQI